jgi:tetratricopeptide (TPR) repeat protein
MDARVTHGSPTVRTVTIEGDAAEAEPAEGGGERPAEAAPRRIEHFVVLQRLGAGGMGTVFSAFDERLERKVALKLVRPRGGSADAGARARLLGEAQALARLSHPNVVTVYEAGVVDEGEVYIAMEHLRGENLRAWQRTPGRGWREIIAAYAAAGAGLAAAHTAGVVHRDFKPDNVLRTHDGRVCVVDFGLALAAPLSDTGGGGAAARSPETPASRVTGTPGYIAPEQFSSGEASFQSDQWSFCAALYEAVYGERPYADRAFFYLPPGGQVERRPGPSDVRARWLWEVLERGLSPRPDERFPSMEGLLAALGRGRDQARRRMVAAGAALVLLTAAGGAYKVSHRTSPCAASPADLAGVWDAAARQLVASALGGTRVPYAAEVARAVTADLDHYGERWLAARRGACEDTHVRKVQSPELLDRRMECLDARKRSLAAAADVFAAHPAQSVARSEAILGSLGDLDACADPGVLRLGLPPPRDAAQMARLDELRRHLSRGEALLLAGDATGAGHAVDAAARIDAALAYPPAHAEVLRLRGRHEILGGRPREGVERLREAITVATENRHDELIADAWLTLARDAGQHHQSLDEAREWVRQAHAWLRRAGRAGDQRLLDVEIARGNVELATGRHADAAATFTRALAEAEARRVEPIRLVPLLRGRAIARVATGQASDALGDYQRALDLGLATWGPAHPDPARTRRALGILLYRRLGRVDEGEREIERARDALRATDGDDSLEVAECEHALSEATMYRGDYAAALAHATRADTIYELRLGPEDRRRGESQIAIGVLRFFQKDYRGSLAAYERAHGVLEASLGAEHVDVGVLDSNIGETLLALGEDEAATERFERALAILRKGRGPSHVDLALPLKGLGLAQLARRHYLLAVTALEESLALRQGAGGGDPQELAETRWALARALAGLGEAPARRRELAAAALAGYQALGPSWEPRSREIAAWLAR